MARKIIEKTVNIADTPKSMRILFETFLRVLLNDSAGGALHGGCAKALLGWILEQEKAVTSSTALKIFLKGDTDLDLIMFKNEDEDLDSLEQRFNAWQTGFAVNKIGLKPDDVVVMKGKNTTEEILRDNDLTINEVFAIPSGNGTLSVYYTDICRRDTVSEIAILTAHGRMTTRLHCGQKLPTNMGVFRLVSALVKGRVKGIYLPKYWIDLNNFEAKRLKTENFGVYGLLLTERFKGDARTQKELMNVLFELGLTDIKNFNVFRQEQELLFQHRKDGKQFLFDVNRTFRQIQEHLRDKEMDGKRGKEIRDQTRLTCNHQITTTRCFDCKDQCKIEKCTKCTLVKVTPPWSKKYVNLNGLLCNRNWENSNVYWDRMGFYP